MVKKKFSKERKQHGKLKLKNKNNYNESMETTASQEVHAHRRKKE